MPLAACDCGDGDGRLSNAAGVLTLSPNTLDFGGVALGAHRDLVLKVKNAGQLTLQFKPATITPEHGPFRLITPAPVQLMPGHEAEVVLRFEPTTAGETEASLSIETDGDPAVASVTELSRLVRIIDR